MAPSPPREAARIAAELAQVGPVLPGSVIRRFTRCGRAGCRCTADPPRPHGPYWSWTRKVANKTVTRYLSDEQWADYGPWFDNARRLRELAGELEAASLAAFDADPRSNRRTRRTTDK
ncbi:hypothetical protein BH24ACT1_BH24ACT1_05160 [soil metagenome]